MMAPLCCFQQSSSRKHEFRIKLLRLQAKNERKYYSDSGDVLCLYPAIRVYGESYNLEPCTGKKADRSCSVAQTGALKAVIAEN